MSTLNNTIAAGISFLPAQAAARRAEGGEDVNEHMHGLGHTGVRSFIQSGNLIFDASRPARRLESQRGADLPWLLGCPNEVYVRTLRDVHRVAAHAARLKTGAVAEVNACFLHAPLAEPAQQALDALSSDVDTFDVRGRDIHWLCTTRQSPSRCSGAVIERAVRGGLTLRRSTMLQPLCVQWPLAAE